MRDFKRVIAAIGAVVLSVMMGFTGVGSANALGGWRGEGIAWSSPATGGVPVYRLYNPYSGQHLYTKDLRERENNEKLGWQYEFIAFQADVDGSPVFRLYNPNDGLHHFTQDVTELRALVALGWIDEGTAWYVGQSADVTVYRLYNTYNGEHLYTTDKNEYDYWAAPDPEPAPNPDPAPNPNPDPAPNPSPEPEIQQGITPGAFCSTEGAKGIGKKNGALYICSYDDNGRLRWRRA